MGRGQGQIDIKWSKLAPLVSIDLRWASKLHLYRERRSGEGLEAAAAAAVCSWR